MYRLDQVSPPLRETVAPPSFPSIIRRLSFGSIHRSCWSPWGMGTSVKLRPPSVDFNVFAASTHTVSGSDGSAKTCV